MKIDIGPIELKYSNLRVMSVTTILAAQHPPPYSDDEIKTAADAASSIIWKVKAMP